MLFRRGLRTLQKSFQWDPLTPDQIKGLVKENSMVSWSAQRAWDPPVCMGQEGVYLINGKGEKIFDANSGLMCSALGHGEPRVIDAIHRAASNVDFAGPPWATEWRARACDEMRRVTPEGSHFFFCLSGAEANENAVRMARAHTGRRKIITRHRSYHGATNLCLNLTGDFRRWGGYEHGGFVRARDAYPYRCGLRRDGDDDAQHTARLLEDLEFMVRHEGADQIAAILIEPIVGTNGVIIPPDGYMKGVREMTKRYGIVMICDEVMTGVGRTGKFWAHEHDDIVPDMISSAKGITSGYLPLGALIINSKIWNSFADKPYGGGLTYMAHPVSMGACAGALRVMREDKIVEHVASLDSFIKSEFAEIASRHKCVGEARSRGFFGAFEIVKDRRTKETLMPYPEAHPSFAKFTNACMQDGVAIFVNPYNSVILFVPPLISTREQLKDALRVIDKNLTIFDAESVE